MKKLILPFVLLIAIARVEASNFVDQPITIATNGGSGYTSSGYLSNNIAGNTTNTVQSVVVACADFNNVGVSILSKLSGAGTAAIDFLFNGTVDGTNYSTANKRTVTVTPAGTITVNTVTNLDCTGFQAIQLIGINNGNATILTNIQADIGYKRAKDVNPNP